MDVALQQLDLTDPTGANRVGFRPQGTAATLDRTVQDKLRESVTFQDFGAHSIEEAGFEDFDSTEAIKNAFAYAFANNKAIHVIGVFKISGPIVRSGAFPLSLIGNGTSHSRIVYAQATATIQLESTDNRAGCGWDVSGIAFICKLPSTASALKLKSTRALSPSNGAIIDRCWFGYDIFGGDSPNGRWFTKNLHLDNIHFTRFNQSVIYGQASPPNNATIRNSIGVYLTGDTTPGPFVNQVHFLHCSYGITKNNELVGGEQLNVQHCNFVACQYGIYLDDSNAEVVDNPGVKTGQPALFVNDCHFNCEFGAIYANKRSQITIHDNLIYGSVSERSDYIDIDVIDSTTVLVHNNIFSGLPDGVAAVDTETVCVRLSDVNYFNINNNIVQGLKRKYGIKIDADCNNGMWSGNAIDHLPVPIVNNITDIKKYVGLSSRVGGYALMYSAPTRVPSTTGQITITNTNTKIQWGVNFLESTVNGVFSSDNPTRFKVPKGVTRIRLSTTATFAINGTGHRGIQILKNGVVFDGMGHTIVPASSTSNTIVQCSTGTIRVIPGDYFEVEVYQNSGSDIDVLVGRSTNFNMDFVA